MPKWRLDPAETDHAWAPRPRMTCGRDPQNLTPTLRSSEISCPIRGHSRSPSVQAKRAWWSQSLIDAAFGALLPPLAGAGAVKSIRTQGEWVSTGFNRRTTSTGSSKSKEVALGREDTARNAIQQRSRTYFGLAAFP